MPAPALHTAECRAGRLGRWNLSQCYAANAPMRFCPCCNLPIDSASIGAAVAASSNDRTAHGVFALCTRCIRDNRRLPATIRTKRISRAGDRALENPDKFICTTYPSIDLARLAVAMLGHPKHAQAAGVALGWVNETQPPNIQH